MLVPTWWIGVTVACFLVTTGAMLAMLVGMIAALTKAQKMLTEATTVALPKVYALSDQLNVITGRVEGLVARIENESHVAMPKVEHMLDRAVHTIELVETNSERMNHVIEGTSESINKVRHNPMTRSVLVGAGGLAAMRLIRNTFRHYTQPNGKSHNGNGKHKQPAH